MIHRFPALSPSLEQNHLLAALPANVRARFCSYANFIQLPRAKCLYEAGDKPNYVFFPTDAVITLAYTIKNGNSTEVSVVGNEGLVGVSVLMDGGSMPYRTVVQNAGGAYRIPVSLLREELHRNSELQVLFFHYLQALMTQMAQTAVCNRYHLIEQQLCRWLLLSLDRVPSNTMSFTQELIASTLGVRREAVTLAAQKLRKYEVVEYCRGKLTIVNREKLELLSCECYGVIREEYDRLLKNLSKNGNSRLFGVGKKMPNDSDR